MNCVRRSVGVTICLAPVVLAAASLAVGALNADWGVQGLGVALGGFLFAVVNAHLSFLRPWLYRRRHGSLSGFRFVSGVPLFGTLCVCASNAIGFGEVITAALGLVTLALDTGGLPWFLACTWRDRGLWDAATATAAPAKEPGGRFRL
jgi:hypothetical protein